LFILASASASQRSLSDCDRFCRRRVRSFVCLICAGERCRFRHMEWRRWDLPPVFLLNSVPNNQFQMCRKTRCHVYKTRPMFNDTRFQSPDLMVKSSSIGGLSENRPFKVSPMPWEPLKMQASTEWEMNVTVVSKISRSSGGRATSTTNKPSRGCSVISRALCDENAVLIPIRSKQAQT